MSGAGLEGFQGSWSNRVGRVEVASLARGGSGSDRRAGSSPYVAPLYEKLGLIRKVTGNSLRPGTVSPGTLSPRTLGPGTLSPGTLGPGTLSRNRNRNVTNPLNLLGANSEAHRANNEVGC